MPCLELLQLCIPSGLRLNEVILEGKPKLEAKLAAGDLKIEGREEELEELLA